MGLSLKYKKGGGAHGSAGLSGATAAFEVLVPAIRNLLDQIRRPGRPVSYMYVMAFDLHRREMFQPSLFDPPDPRRRRLAEIKRHVNAKIGRFTLRSAATLPLVEVYADKAYDYDISDIEGEVVLLRPGACHLQPATRHFQLVT